MDEQRWLTFADFGDRVGEQFRLEGEETSTLELVEATEGDEPGGVGPCGRSRRQFSLVLAGGPVTGLPQATYRLRHDELGVIDLFLVPIGPGAGVPRYEAAFA